MKRLLLVATLLLCASPFASAQERHHAVPLRAATNAEQHPSMANMTPEMWLYLQEQQRSDDPEMAVRRKAEFRAEQRTHRIAARKWFGLSNARPSANPVPVMGTYSPHWSGNTSDPYTWSGVGPTVIRIEEDVDLLR